MTKTPQIHSEGLIMQQMVIWYNNTYCLATARPNERGIIFHIPNENQHRLIGVGLLPGVSDLIVIHPGITRPLFIEVKDHKGKQSPKQAVFEQRIKALGYTYALVRSLDEFKSLIQNINNS